MSCVPRPDPDDQKWYPNYISCWKCTIFKLRKSSILEFSLAVSLYITKWMTFWKLCIYKNNITRSFRHGFWTLHLVMNIQLSSIFVSPSGPWNMPGHWSVPGASDRDRPRRHRHAWVRRGQYGFMCRWRIRSGVSKDLCLTRRNKLKEIMSKSIIQIDFSANLKRKKKIYLCVVITICAWLFKMQNHLTSLFIYFQLCILQLYKHCKISHSIKLLLPFGVPIYATHLSLLHIIVIGLSIMEANTSGVFTMERVYPDCKRISILSDFMTLPFICFPFLPQDSFKWIIQYYLTISFAAVRAPLATKASSATRK